MAVTGNYHEIAMFLQVVANMRRIVNVNNIQLGSPIDEDREGGAQHLASSPPPSASSTPRRQAADKKKAKTP